MHDTDNLIRFYTEDCNEDERLLSRPGQAEFLTTLRYLDRYLFSGAKVLEIGAGTGRYNHHLARQGYKVEALELVPRNIEIFRQNTLSGEQVNIREGNALDLSAFPDESFDLTLLLGPMYHLYTFEDRQKALAEAVRVTKKDGVIFAAYCIGDASIMQFGFIRGNIKNVIEQGLLDPTTFDTIPDSSVVFSLYRKENIDELNETLPVQRLHYVGTDLLTHLIRDTMAAMDDETFKLYMQYHYNICEREDMVGMTNHSLDILRRVDCRRA